MRNANYSSARTQRLISGAKTGPRRLAVFFFALSSLILVGQSPLLAFSAPSLPDAPESMTVKDKTVILKNLKNPFRDDLENLAENIKEGGNVYFKNCFLCHGDLLDGKGVFGASLFPPPADFQAPQSILDKPEHFAYWRIVKGGRGLPKQFKPWDSAMPAWENTLSEEEIWKVILFIYETARENTNTDPIAAPSLARGKEVYLQKCAYCHGITGKGDGPASPYSSPRPRKLIKGHLKIRSTAFGKIPTDADILSAITNGLPGGSMPAWKHLPINDRLSLVQYIKTLSKKFAKFKKKGKTHKIITVPPPKAFSLESMAAGKDLFLKNCSGCHGSKGRGDGESIHRIVNIEKDSLYPRNLGKPWKFRRGFSRRDIFATIRTGLSLTAMPQFSKRMFSDSQIWDIVNYVQTLSLAEKPKVRKTIVAKKISGELPANPTHPAWKFVTTFYFPLAGQIIKSPKSYYPTVDSLYVQAIHNGEEIAFRLIWDDPTVDPALRKSGNVEESPPPPLPPELVAGSDVEEIPVSTDPQKFPDAIALQFPASNLGSAEKPYFLNGDEGHPVNMWKWSSWPTKTIRQIARGIGNIKPKTDKVNSLSSNFRFIYGQYQLVIKRKLARQDESGETQFSQQKPTPIAFNVWDGTEGETGSKKAISSWFEIILQ